jgi:glutamine synthetase
MFACIHSGLQISGINSEVSEKQWEFQIGPCEGILAGDHLIIARYLLEKIAEKYDVRINYHPKPDKNINGSGCHINFSTFKTRDDEDGIEEINRCIKCLSENHEELIKVYGNNNDLRLTGFHETSSYNKFSWGVGTRNTSVRIPNQVIRDNGGYFEDRRPASNIDPYLATSNLFKVCYLDVEKDDDF